MTDRVRLQWKVPASVWDRFREYVTDEYGSVEVYLGRETEMAMREYTENDDGTRAEDLVDRLVQAAGRRPEDVVQKNNSQSAPVADEFEGAETKRVSPWVNSQFKSDFKQHVDADERDDSYGIALARAIERRMDGGRYGRIERKLERVVDDAEGLLALMEESDAEESLGKVERQTVQICHRLPEQFTDTELNEEIHDVAGRAGTASDPTLEKYRDLVVERLDVEPHPNAPHVWVPESVAEEIAPDVPTEARRPVTHLDRSERIERLKLVVGRRAAERGNGMVKVDRSDVQEDILEGEVSVSTALDLMEEAGLAAGYGLDRAGDKAWLKVDLNRLGRSDEQLLERIIDYRDSAAESLIEETTATTMDDWENDGDDASVTMDDLASATPATVTDGGGPRRDSGEETDGFTRDEGGDGR